MCRPSTHHSCAVTDGRFMGGYGHNVLSVADATGPAPSIATRDV